MFLHNLKYELITTLRTKDLILWLMIFPIFLGTMFKAVFGSIYEKTTVFSAIPTAIVMTGENVMFREVINSVSEGDEPLMKATFADEDKALEMLKNGEVEGVIYAGEDITLTVSGKGMQETILKSFIEQYGVYASVITDTLSSDPAKLTEVVDALKSDVETCAEIPVTTGNTDQFIQYFYNLIAMVAIYGSITGLHITIANQANMSPLGARRNCSPTPKSSSIAASLLGCFIAQSVCMLLCVTYLAFVLRIDFGSRLPLVYLSAILGGCLGVTMGYFVGSISRLSSNMKVGINMSVSMTLCFLSGLMVGDIKGVIAEKAPWFNQINPVAIISDSFYCLNLYTDYRRFTVKIISMLIYIVLFSALGIILSRRKKYASI